MGFGAVVDVRAAAGDGLLDAIKGGPNHASESFWSPHDATKWQAQTTDWFVEVMDVVACHGSAFVLARRREWKDSVRWETNWSLARLDIESGVKMGSRVSGVCPQGDISGCTVNSLVTVA